MIVSRGTHIACCVDVAPDFAVRAKYALRMLLTPLGLEPRWISPDALADMAPPDAPVLYYGRHGTTPPDPRIIPCTHAPGAAVFLAGTSPFDAKDATACEIEGESVPVCFADEKGHPDIVASTFLWLSGWQEQATERRDEHGRVPFADSLPARFDTALLSCSGRLSRMVG